MTKKTHVASTAPPSTSPVARETWAASKPSRPPSAALRTKSRFDRCQSPMKFCYDRGTRSGEPAIYSPTNNYYEVHEIRDEPDQWRSNTVDVWLEFLSLTGAADPSANQRTRSRCGGGADRGRNRWLLRHTTTMGLLPALRKKPIARRDQS